MNTLSPTRNAAPVPSEQVERFKVGQKVFWNDPDGGICSDYATITYIRGDGDPDYWEDQIFVLQTDRGSEVEAVMSELSENCPSHDYDAETGSCYCGDVWDESKQMSEQEVTPRYEIEHDGAEYFIYDHNTGNALFRSPSKERTEQRLAKLNDTCPECPHPLSKHKEKIYKQCQIDICACDYLLDNSHAELKERVRELEQHLTWALANVDGYSRLFKEYDTARAALSKGDSNE